MKVDAKTKTVDGYQRKTYTNVERFEICNGSFYIYWNDGTEAKIDGEILGGQDE